MLKSFGVLLFVLRYFVALENTVLIPTTLVGPNEIARPAFIGDYRTMCILITCNGFLMSGPVGSCCRAGTLVETPRFTTPFSWITRYHE